MESRLTSRMGVVRERTIHLGFDELSCRRELAPGRRFRLSSSMKLKIIFLQTLAFWVIFSAVNARSDTPAVDVEKSRSHSTGKKYLVLPVKDDVMQPLVFLVRRGVKEAMEKKADLLILDMDTNGGRVDLTEEIIEILGKFQGETVTYVNRKAFSAGAFIAVSTRKIFMAEQSVIGAAAPIMMAPGGGVESMPDTVERKMTSGISALVRASAEKNGHNVDVIEAMIDKTKELKLDGKVINEKGRILTLTNLEAERTYGDPPKRLLSTGTMATLDGLVTRLGYDQASRIHFQPTGAEKLASWIHTISPLLLILGVAGLYIEFKTPGFGLPGIVGISAFAIYFFGGYVAGLSGWEWAALFVLGAALIVCELIAFPGIVVLGLTGALLMFLSVVMAMLDFYPGMPLMPNLPGQLGDRAMHLLITLSGSVLVIWLIGKWFPETRLYRSMVSTSSSGAATTQGIEQMQSSQVGQVGIAVSVLRPGGKARFGEEIRDVISQGEMIARGEKVRILRHSAAEAVVERVE